jgi:hypothetical protein
MMSVDGGYTRKYLQTMKQVEDERQERVWILESVENVQNSILETAVKGLTSLSTNPVDCRQAVHFKKSVDRCEAAVKEIKDTIGRRFPDSDISYDSDTKVYTIRWD